MGQNQIRSYIFSTGVSFRGTHGTVGYTSFSFDFDIDRGIMFTVMDSPTPQTKPFTLRQLQGLIDPMADITLFGRREKTSDLLNVTTSPLTFVLTLPHKLRPAGIRDSLGQTLVFEHALDVKVFKADEPVVPNQMVGQLMLKIQTLIGHFFMLPCQRPNRFLSAIGSLFLTGNLAL